MLNGKELGRAIREAIEKKLAKGDVKSRAEIARHFGIKPPSITDWEKKGSISKDKLPKLWAYFSDVAGPEHWGLQGWPMTDNEHANMTEPGDEFVPITRVNLRVSAGVTGFRVEHIHGNGPPIFFRQDWLSSKGFKAEKLFALKVMGDSMEPNLWEGDLVVMNAADTRPVDGEVFVVNYEGEPIIKRLMRDAGEWWLTSDNARHKPKRCDEHAEILGRVVYKQSERI